MDKRLQWAITKIMDKVSPDFFGTFTLTFQNGKLSHIKQEETFTAPKT